MIHQVYLPDMTRKRLTDVVMLQIRLLYYASSTATPDKIDCASYLDRHARFRGRGPQIAAWIWNAPKTRRKFLENFAKGPSPEKWEWSRRLARDALILLHRPIGHLTPFIRSHSAPWQREGAEFLRKFYADLCSYPGLPGDLFSDAVASAFRRQDFLTGFRGMNSELSICAACDESGYSTVDASSVYTDIEHYLPKSRYPHLACHPFNLLPLCPLCNRLKRYADPLKGHSHNPRSLEDIFLPYREPGLGAQTYLQVRLGKGHETTRFVSLKSRGTSDLRQKIEAFRAVYKIPKRWQGKVEAIGESLFRRLIDMLEAWGLSSGNNLPQAVLPPFMHCLHSLSERQHGKEPFAFVMTWWLAALITHEVEPAMQNPTHPAPQTSALLQEVASWADTHISTPSHAISPLPERLGSVERLLDLVRESEM